MTGGRDENRRSPDLGDGQFLNPILGGDYPDPSVLRVGDEYYMTHSGFTYGPVLLIWRSADLVNWEPVRPAVPGYGGDVYAPDFIRHKDAFYIYYAADRTNWVVTAPSPEGPWSEPTNLGIRHFIDPGHVVGPDGKRYLHLAGGRIIGLADDGLSTVGELGKVYDGWRYPLDWRVEGFCLEGPKFTAREGWYYLTVAEGGTAGPATSHMVASSRARTPHGPWEHSPYNPIIHTGSPEERWHSRGHGTLVEATDGSWWMMYHAYEKGYRTLGRQTLLSPIEWTKDGWFKVPDSFDVEKPARKPPGRAVRGGLGLSDGFAGPRLGAQWRFFGGHDPARYSFEDRSLRIQSKGTSPADSSPMLCIPTEHAYEAEVEMELSGGSAEGGLILFYNPSCWCGVGLREGGVFRMRRSMKSEPVRCGGGRVRLRLVNDHHDVLLFYRPEGGEWTRFEEVTETSGYHHNVFGGFVSLRLGMYAAGSGWVKARDFRYKGIE